MQRTRNCTPEGKRKNSVRPSISPESPIIRSHQSAFMRLPRLIFVFLLSLSGGLPAQATSSSADAPHVHVRLVFPGGNFLPVGHDPAGLYFQLEPGWHIYWKNPGDAGEPPHIQWTLPDGVAAGPMQFPVPKRLPLGPLMDFGYENDVLFPIALDVAKGAKPGPAMLHAKVDWLVCRAVCIPGKADLEVTRYLVVEDPKGTSYFPPDAGAWVEFQNSFPKPLPSTDKAIFQPTKDGFRLSVETGQKETEASFFPSDENILDNPAPQMLTPTARGLVLDLKKDASLAANPAQLKGVLELSGGRAFEFAALPGKVTAQPLASAASHPAASVAALFASGPAPTPSPANPSGGKPLSLSELVRVSGLAFLGGLILNLMPCVFPVLFLKGLALVNSGNEERHKLRAHGFVYTAGILVSFWVLVAVLLGLRAAGATLGWGFQFQSPIFLELMAGLLFFLGLSLAGQFEIGLSLTSAGGALLVDKQGRKARLHRQLFHGRFGSDRGYALHCTVHGSSHWLRSCPARRSDVCRLHGAGSWPGRALCCAYAATGLDASASQTRRMDGGPAAGSLSSNLCHSHLAGVGAGAGLRLQPARGIAGEFFVAGHCRVVPGPLAGQALGCRQSRLSSCSA